MSTQPTSNSPNLPPRPSQEIKPQPSDTRPSPSKTTTASHPVEGDKPSGLSKAFSTQKASKLAKAYATTLLGMSPIYLMGEALVPGRKVGTTFMKGGKELYTVAEEISKELAISSDDVILVMDKQLRSTNAETSRVAKLVKEAGENAIILVTSNLEKAQGQIKKDSPAMKRSIMKHSKDVIILADKSLKNPIVITGIAKFARSKGIPRPEALVGVASLGLAKLLELLEKEISEFEAKEGEDIFEIDAEELHRVSSLEAETEAENVTRVAHEAEKGVPENIGRATTTPEGNGKGKKKDDGCVIC